jgi:repressor LexA
MSNLTQKQQDFLDYLKERLERGNRIPSLREIAADLGISHTAVNQYLKALEDKGHVKRDGRYSRNILLLNRARETAGPQRWREVPIIGRIAAGLPMYAQQEWDGTIVLDADVYRGQNLFALRIKGDSMVNAGILDGDLAICEPRQFARNGEIVVALLHGEEATVKRFYLKGDQIELRPENDQYESRYYDFGDILIQGKVVGLNRGPDQIARL